MKNLLGSCLLVVLAVGTAHAGLDPDPDSMGIYFDPDGDSNCLMQPPFVPFNAYLLLSNPTATTSGFACTLTLEGGPYFLLWETLGGGGIDVDASPDGYMVSTEPYDYAVVSGQIQLLTLSIMLQSSTPLDFYLGRQGVPSVPPTSCPRPIVWGPDGERCCGVSSGDVLLPVASVNGMCPVADEPSSFGAVKALYR